MQKPGRLGRITGKKRVVALATNYTPARLYLQSTGAVPYPPPGVNTTVFNRTSNGGRTVRAVPLTPTVQGSAHTADTWTYQAPDATSKAICLFQGVSSLPLTAQTLSGPVKVVYAANENQAGYQNLWPHFVIKVMGTDGTIRGSQTFGPSSQVEPAANNVNVQAKTLTLTGITAQAGDYLVIEWGFESTSTAVATTLTTWLGDAATDLPYDPGNTTTAGNPWIEFTNGITFQNASGGGGGGGGGSGGGTGLTSVSPAAGVIRTIPTTVTLTFDGNLGSSAGVASNWTVTSSTGSPSVSAATVSGNTVSLTLINTAGIYSGSTIQITGSGILFANGSSVSASVSYQWYNNSVGTITGLPFVPLALTSTWNQLLPSNPTLRSNSTTLITNLFTYAWGHFNLIDAMGAMGDIGPIYLSTGTDPTVTIHPTGGYGFAQASGIPMPTSAQPAGGVDAHVTIINLSTGDEFDYFQFNQAGTTIAQGATLNCTAYGHVNFLTGSGWDEGVGTNGAAGSLTTGDGGIVTSAGNTLMAGVVTLDELQSGRINHKISLAVGANWGAAGAWPASAAAKYTPPGQSVTGVGIGPGSLIWCDLTDAQVDALGWDLFSTLILKALHHYGGFVTDQNGYVPMDIRQWNVVPATDTTGQTTANNWIQTNGNAGSPAIQSQSAAWYEAHLHVVDPTWFQTFSGGVR